MKLFKKIPKYFSRNDSHHHSVPIKRTKLLIDGKFVDAIDGQTFETVNPYTEGVLAKVSLASKRDVDLAVKSSRKAFEGSWAKVSPEERGRLLNKLADLMEKNIDELALLETLDNGKPLSDSRNIDVPLSIRNFRYYAGWADKIHGAVVPTTGPFFTYTRDEPVGIAAQIYAWNFPLVLASWKLGPALATGCVSILKPAEQTPLTALRLGELILEAGFPPGVVNVLPGFGETGEELVKHPGIDKISFTGSTEVGKRILSSNGYPNVKRITLELGGKSANIIMDDADLDVAIKQAHISLFFNQGQCCIAGSRLFVHEKIYDEFIHKSVNLVKQKKLGDPLDLSTTQGPQIDKVQQNKILSYIETGHKEGAKVLIGGTTEQVGKGFFVNPTIFVDVHDEMTIAKEEIFGPVMSVMKFKTIDEVIHRANKSNYGLGAGLVTKDMNNIIKIAHSLKVGTVYVNTYDNFEPHTPFGGFKDSGLGRELGKEGLKPYLECKTVMIGLNH